MCYISLHGGRGGKAHLKLEHCKYRCQLPFDVLMVMVMIIVDCISLENDDEWRWKFAGLFWNVRDASRNVDAKGARGKSPKRTWKSTRPEVVSGAKECRGKKKGKKGRGEGREGERNNENEDKRGEKVEKKWKKEEGGGGGGGEGGKRERKRGREEVCYNAGSSIIRVGEMGQ